MTRFVAPAALLSTLFFTLSAEAKTVNVTDVPSLTAAISAAAPGDEIVLAAGTYHFTSSPVCGAAGTSAAPIVVHAATPLGAKIEFDALEGFHVTGPNWHFEGLEVQGVCADDSNCEHAFHVTGAASGFVLRGNRLIDFNAQLKVNADKPSGTWLQPNGGLVEGNEVYDTHARATSNPVTKLNIDGVDNWVVRANILHDGHKNGGDGVSYQSFMKGGGKNGLYERNLVICTKDDTSGGTRIGLSFGGGGTGPQYCAPAFDASVPCDPEMTDSTMRNNIIVNCSDVAIYLNKSKNSHILYNTMIGTNGVDFRFASTSGEADGNVLASVIRTRDGGMVTKKTNLENVAATDFTAWYVNPLIGDLHKKGDLSSLLGKGTARPDVTDDYCARLRTGAFDLGALQSSLGDCDTTKPPLGTSSGDAGPATDGGDDGGTSSGFDASTTRPDDDAGSTTNGDSAGDSGGCGCTTPGDRAPAGALAFVALGVALALARIKRR